MPVCGEGGVKEREGMEEMDGGGRWGNGDGRRWHDVCACRVRMQLLAHLSAYPWVLAMF